MNIALWIAQVLLALLFALVGQLHAFQYERIKIEMVWPAAVPRRLMFFIGMCEVLGAAGVILPALTGILPWLTPVAAAALAVLMLLAIGFHIPRREGRSIGLNTFLFVLAAFVAYGRFVLVPLK